MTKKILCWCLLLLFICPLPANANLADDVKQFKQKYADIYQNIDPVLTQKMETFLEDVVNYVVANHTTTTSVDIQIKDAIGSTLLTGDTYKNDLLPFLLDQAANKEIYASQLREMQAIVRREVEYRLNAQTPTTPGGGVNSPNVPLSSADVEINSQISEGKLIITVVIKKGQESLDISGASLQKIATTGNILKIQGADITITMNGNTLNLPANDVWRVQIRHILPQQSDSLIQNLPSGNRIIGPVYELNSIINNSPMQATFAKPIDIEIHYNDSELQGVTEDSLNAYYYNESMGKWEKMNGSVDKTNNTITFTTTHFSKYAIMTNVEQKPATEPKSEPEPKTEQTTPTTTGAEKFTDLTGHWAAAEIGTAVKLGIASGMSPTQFAPDLNITRAQFATLLTRALGIKNSTSLQSRFSDVTADAWYYNAVNSAAEAGLVSGYSPTSFGPNDLITREQMAVMIRNALAYKNKQVNCSTSVLDKFQDREQISSWAIPGVSTAVDQGIITGRSPNTIAPRQHATRAEGTAMILRMYKLL